MRIVRPQEGRARLAVAAGFQLGARPAALAPLQRDLYSALTHRAFAGVLDQAVRAGCQALVCGGGLFADPLPSLEHVRAAMAPLGSARRAGLTVIGVREHPGQSTDGTSFLAEVGLIDAVLDAHAPGSVLVSAANLQIALVTGGASGDLREADLTIALAAPGSNTADPIPPPGGADVVVDTGAPTAGSDRLDDIPVIEPGWAGPSLNRETQPGFAVLDIDPGAGVVPTFAVTEALQPTRLVVDSPQTGGGVAHLIEPQFGAAGILDVELCGRTSRSVWHAVDPAGLIERAAAAGTLLRFTIDRLIVDDSENATTAPDRPSFLVNARRVSERLAAAAEDTDQRDMVAAARARVVEIARRREPTKAVA